MKRILTLALAVLMLALAVTGCGKATTEEKEPSYKILTENFGDEVYAVAFRRDDNALTLKVQEILDAMASEGKSDEIAQKWFGTNSALKDQDFPREITATEGDTSLQYVLDKGTLILGLDDAYPPMGFRNEDGEIIGFDIDMAKEVAARLGVELVIQPISWDSKEFELSSKNIDCIWNGVSVNDSRIEEFNMTKPYLPNAQVILVADNSGIETKADLAGKKIGTQAGSAAMEALESDEYKDVADTFDSIEQYDNYNSAYMDLKAGRISAVIGDKTFIEYILAQDNAK